MQKPRTPFIVVGTGPFEGIRGRTKASSIDKAICNVARRKGLMDRYQYFKNYAEVYVGEHRIRQAK